MTVYGVEVKRWHCEDIANGWEDFLSDFAKLDFSEPESRRWENYWRTVRDLMLAGF